MYHYHEYIFIYTHVYLYTTLPYMPRGHLNCPLILIVMNNSNRIQRVAVNIGLGGVP